MKKGNVKLRKKLLENGMISLYLDFYPPILNTETNKYTRREFLKLYLFERPKNPIQKISNIETLHTAELIQIRRQNEMRKHDVYSEFEKEQLEIQRIGGGSFLEYFKNLAEKKEGNNYQIWYTAIIHFENFLSGRDVTFKDITVTLMEDYKEYLLKAKNRRDTGNTLARNTALSYHNKLKTTLKRAYKEGKLRTDINAGIDSIKEQESGFFTWTSKTKEKKIVYRDSYIDQLFYSSKRQKFFFKEQKFDLSPRLVEADKSTHCKPFFQSNPQQQNYFWGKSELIRYQNSKGLGLRGALLYPANYDPTKKYPMVVEIYELISKEMHYYKNPSLYNEDGFNRTNFSVDGYFILLPDITQEYRNVGASLVDCVTSAVDKVLERNIINPDRIGLIGFSAGGYETAFTITQTNRFATAIAGGTNADLRSLYFSIGNGTGKSEMWRFQSRYWMLEKTPFQAPELYDASSPLFHVQKVQTPLLLWTGKNDPQVDPHQSMAFYLALRSFEKKVIMLQYPAETHSISNPVNQSDLTSRMHNWFDYFLKDIPCDWLENGIR